MCVKDVTDCWFQHYNTDDASAENLLKCIIMPLIKARLTFYCIFNICINSLTNSIAYGT